MHTSRKMNATRNAAAGIFNRIVGLIVPFFLRTALIKILGEEYLGLSSLFMSILQVLNLADLGFSTAIVYSMYKPIAENDDAAVCALLRLYRIIYVIIGLIILVAGLGVMPFLENLIQGGYPDDLNIYVLYLMYLVNTVSGYLFFAHRQSLMAAFQRSDIEANVNSIVQLLLDILKIVTLIAFRNYYLYIIFVPITTIVSGIITTVISYRLYPQYRAKGVVPVSEKKDIMKRVSGLTIQKFGDTISTSLDSIIISSFLGLSVLAVYSNYFYIASALMSFLWVCISATTAGLGNSIVLESVEKNWVNFKKINFLNQWTICWIFPSLVCLYQHFMRIWVGEQLMFGLDMVLWLAIYFYVAQSRKVVLVFKDAAGIWWEDRWKPLVGCLFNLTVNILLVKLIGISGIIISTVASYLLIESPWEIHALFKHYFHFSEWKYYKDQIRFIAIIVMNTLLCGWVCGYFPYDGILYFIIKGCICVLLSNLIFFLCFHKSFECIELFRDVSRVFHSRVSKT